MCGEGVDSTASLFLFLYGEKRGSRLDKGEAVVVCCVICQSVSILTAVARLYQQRYTGHDRVRHTSHHSMHTHWIISGPTYIIMHAYLSHTHNHAAHWIIRLGVKS